MARDRLSSADKIVKFIGDEIRAGRLTAGQRLVEAELSRTTGMSRGPIREALKRLSAEGVVTLTLHRGAFIRVLTRAEAEKLVDVFEVLLGLAAKRAAEQIDSTKNKQRLLAAFESLNASHDGNNVISYERERRNYYDTVIDIGANEQISKVLPGTQRHLLRMQLRSFWSPAANDAHNADYGAITDAIISGNAAKAERVMKAHIRRIRLGIGALPNAAFPLLPK